jgi:predicted phosphoribosyltransferase
LKRLRNRSDAGNALADNLAELTLVDPVVLALPRGGVPVGVVIADRFGSPVKVFVARKIGLPGHEEFGIGAIAEGIRVMTAWMSGYHAWETETLRYRSATKALPNSGPGYFEVVLHS